MLTNDDTGLERVIQNVEEQLDFDNTVYILEVPKG